MVKNKGGVTVWWYESDTGSLCMHHFSSVPNNGSYEAEVHIKYARSAVRMVTVHDNGLGYDSLERLKAEALEYRNSLKPAT